MMQTLGAAAVAVSGSLALSLLVKATGVSAIALVAATFARRSRASVRHLLLATGFFLLLTLPLASIVVPPRVVNLPIERTGLVLPRSAATLDPLALVAPRAATQGRSSGDHRPALRLSASQLVAAAWLAGVAFVMIRLIAGLVRIRRLCQHGLPWPAGQTFVSDLAARLAVRTRIQVLLDDAAIGPMTCGVMHPAIVLPRDARTWNEDDLRRAIVHELEHIRRGDWLVLCAARATCAIYWFHPLVWMAWRQLRLEAEKACDDAVLREEGAEAYADQLVTLAERALAGVTPPALAMANRGDLFARVTAVLDERQARGRAGARSVVIAGAIGALLLFATAPLRAGIAPRAVERLLAAPLQVSADAPPPRFDVVSVKANNSGSTTPALPRLTPGHAAITNVGLRQLIQMSYGIQPYQLVGLPAWAETARFDITATAKADASPAQLLLMVRGLLADRFQLSTRTETSQLDVYSLVQRAPGSSKLRPSQANCAAAANAPLSQALAGAGGRDGQPRCQILPMTGRGRLIATGVAVRDIANVLTGVTGRLVVDRTGLEGPFDVNLAWTPDPALQAVIRQNDPLSVPDAPSIFTAVEEQLGLRLASDRGPVDVIVVERLEPPTSD